MEFKDYQRMRVVMKTEINNHHNLVRTCEEALRYCYKEISTHPEDDKNRIGLISLTQHYRVLITKSKKKIKQLAKTQHEVKKNLR